MTAKLLIREVGGREFVQHNGDYEDDPHPNILIGRELDQTGYEKASAEGERMCREGNVEAFQVWVLHSAKQRVWNMEDIES